MEGLLSVAAVAVVSDGVMEFTAAVEPMRSSLSDAEAYPLDSLRLELTVDGQVHFTDDLANYATASGHESFVIDDVAVTSETPQVEFTITDGLGNYDPVSGAATAMARPQWGIAVSPIKYADAARAWEDSAYVVDVTVHAPAATEGHYLLAVQAYYYIGINSGYGRHSLTENDPDLRSLRLYADMTVPLTKSLTLRAGLRGQLWSVDSKGYFCPEGRLALSWAAGDRLRLSAGYDRTSQALHQLTSANIVTPSDIWVPITEDIAPMTANHCFAEVAVSLPVGKDSVELSVQGYYKTMDNLVEYREQASLTDAMRWEESVCLGTGKAYGVEVLATRDFGKLSGTLSYTWGKSLRQFDEVNEGRESYAANDRRHDLKALLSYAVTERLSVRASFTYHTGDRFTLAHYTGLGNIYFLQDPSADDYGSTYVYSSLSVGAIDVPVYKERNNYRLMDYHRLDVGVDYRIPHRRAESVVGLSVYNCYNRMNPYTLQYGYDESGQLGLYNVCIMPLMPALSYTLKF